MYSYTGEIMNDSQDYQKAHYCIPVTAKEALERADNELVWEKGGTAAVGLPVADWEVAEPSGLALELFEPVGWPLLGRACGVGATAAAPLVEGLRRSSL